MRLSFSGEPFYVEVSGVRQHPPHFVILNEVKDLKVKDGLKTNAVPIVEILRLRLRMTYVRVNFAEKNTTHLRGWCEIYLCLIV